MNLFEYQAKAEFAKMGIPVPRSVLVQSAGEGREALLQTGLPCVVKCQVLTGGRGKAGLVRLVKTQEEALALLDHYFSTLPRLHAVLLEEAVDYEKEVYLSLTMDANSGQAVLMGSPQGGMDIEQVARQQPEAILRQEIDLRYGLQGYQIRDFLFHLGLPQEAFKEAGRLLASLYRLFCRRDAELLEINPLFVTRQGQVVAGDGKLNLDDNAMFRQADFQKGREHYDSDMAYEAAQEGIPYLEFEGDISLMCAGAGLANTVYDLIQFEGGSVSNYLEFGGPNYMKAGTAMRLCLQNRPRVILIVTFGTIARADVMAEGIVKAIEELKPDCPIVACLRGTGEEEVDRIFAPLGLTRETDTETAVKKAVAIARQRREP